MDLEDLVLFGARRERCQLRGEKQMNDFCKNAGRGNVVTERAPRGGRHACFFFELAARGIEWRLAIVDLAGGQFPDPTVDGVTKLAQQADAIVGVERNHRGAAGMADDFEIRDRAVRQLHALDVHFDDAAGEDVLDVDHLNCRPCLRPSPGPTSADTNAPTTCRRPGSATAPPAKSTRSRRCSTASPNPTRRSAR